MPEMSPFIFVISATIGGLLIGTGIGLLIAHRRLKAWEAMQSLYWSRPLDDPRTFKQFCADVKNGREQ